MALNRSDVSPETIQSSVTALAVGMAFARSLFTGHDYIFDINEGRLTEHLCHVGKKSVRGITWLIGEGLERLPYTWQQSFFNYAVFPGYDQNLLLRKLMIKQEIDNAIDRGIKQIVFLGGGYDIRGLLTALNHPDVQVYEIDRGPTRESKLSGLRSIPQGIGFDDIKVEEVSPNLSKINNNMHYINADLSIEALPQVLVSHGYQQEAGTLFIAEGLTMYLEESANRRLLESVKDLMQSESEMLISYATKPVYSRITKPIQTKSNELYKFILPLEKVIDFISQSELGVTQKFSASDALGLVHDTNASYFSEHPDEGREFYYIVKKQEMAPSKNINDVPFIQLDVPEKPVEFEKPGFCQIL